MEVSAPVVAVVSGKPNRVPLPTCPTIWGLARAGVDFDHSGPDVSELLNRGFTEEALIESGIWQRVRGGRLARTFGGFLAQCYERCDSNSTAVLELASLNWNHGNRTINTVRKEHGVHLKRGGK